MALSVSYSVHLENSFSFCNLFIISHADLLQGTNLLFISFC